MASGAFGPHEKTEKPPGKGDEGFQKETPKVSGSAVRRSKKGAVAGEGEVVGCAHKLEMRDSPTERQKKKRTGRKSSRTRT